MSRPKVAKLAIVGCSGYAMELIKRIWMFRGEIELVAAFSPDLTLPEVALCEQRGVRVIDDFDSFIEYIEHRVHAVMNPTPIHRHKEISIRCLQAGLPVWVEKPPVATLHEWDELREAARFYAKPVEVCFNALYLPSVRLVKDRLLQGEFGRMHRIRGVGAWARPRSYFTRSDWAGHLRVDGDWVLDGTINNPLAHLLCNCLYFGGAEAVSMARPVKMSARLWHANDIESEDTSSLRIITDTDVEIVTNMTLCSERMVAPEMTIETEKADIVFRDFQDMDICWHDGKIEAFPSARENRLDMLETLCRSLFEEVMTPCPLECTRPFTEVVNAAFYQVLSRSEGCVPSVHPGALNRFVCTDGPCIGLCGIDQLVLDAYREGAMLDLPCASGESSRLDLELVEELSPHASEGMPT
ncbi:Gfo/Idh/MocA family oxidoreductase [Ruficoccus amylovorans]|uniref:Gfo/Idh/MocA family oxidoreductase n=1 Tax=Ruficoccus amylovorans TaxID=1804625 RepID=A0A842HJ27_9BACT|nr:Gfo/Idh/MocA family oxidoreductase [Ruficoccus amylovorans]MBC2595978.1 Gfo/Idh/MocA family oxidoreductase [Ruficoccus amylovorans]